MVLLSLDLIDLVEFEAFLYVNNQFKFCIFFTNYSKILAIFFKTNDLNIQNRVKTCLLEIRHYSCAFKM